MATPKKELDGTVNTPFLKVGFRNPSRLNDVKILEINFGAAGCVMVIDSEKMNATSEDGETFLNRKVVGNYDNVRLRSGDNKISFTGAVTAVTIANRSRWL